MSDSEFAFLLLRDGPRCYICGQAPDTNDVLQVEHVVPKAAGTGASVEALDNKRLAHRSCNRTKGTAAVVRPTKPQLNNN